MPDAGYIRSRANAQTSWWVTNVHGGQRTGAIPKNQHRRIHDHPGVITICELASHPMHCIVTWHLNLPCPLWEAMSVELILIARVYLRQPRGWGRPGKCPTRGLQERRRQGLPLPVRKMVFPQQPPMVGSDFNREATGDADTWGQGCANLLTVIWRGSCSVPMWRRRSLGSQGHAGPELARGWDLGHHTSYLLQSSLHLGCWVSSA